MSDSDSAFTRHDRSGRHKGRHANAGTNLVRIGAQPYRLADFYFHLVHGSWQRLLVVFGLTFLVLNSAFALLYMLDPESVAGASKGLGFADAFFFSVQTMCTIGYGQLSPANAYSNVIVTIEVDANGSVATEYGRFYQAGVTDGDRDGEYFTGWRICVNRYV